MSSLWCPTCGNGDVALVARVIVNDARGVTHRATWRCLAEGCGAVWTVER